MKAPNEETTHLRLKCRSKSKRSPRATFLWIGLSKLRDPPVLSTSQIALSGNIEPIATSPPLSFFFTILFCNLISNTLLIRYVPDEVYKSVNAVGEDEKWWEVNFFLLLLNSEMEASNFQSEMLFSSGLIAASLGFRLWSCKS